MTQATPAKLATIALCFAFSGISPTPAAAQSIQFEAIDLADTTPGENLWAYRYTVDGAFDAFEGFNVLFDSALFTQLQDPPADAGADWTVQTTQPNPGLPAAGLFTGTANTANPSLAGPFSVSFVFLGQGAPGAQPFEFFNSNFDAVPSGNTKPASVVPVPPALIFMLSGVLALGKRRR